MSNRPVRLATTAFVGLGAITACTVAGALIHADSQRDIEEQSALAANHWTVEASADHGTTWNMPITAADDGRLTMSIDTRELQSKSDYRSFTLRTAAGSEVGADVAFDDAELIEGDDAVASQLGVRAVRSLDGTCAAPAFDWERNRSLFSSTDGHPQAFDSTITNASMSLPAATHSTGGAPSTLCFELSLDPAVDAPDGVVTIGWPVEADPKQGHESA